MTTTLILYLKPKTKNFTKILVEKNLIEVLKNVSRNLINLLLNSLYLLYKLFFNPQFGYACKFHPSCSCYSKEAFLKLPFYKAFILVTWRILRCHPFSRGGLDPVPSEEV